VAVRRLARRPRKAVSAHHIALVIDAESKRLCRTGHVGGGVVAALQAESKVMTGCTHVRAHDHITVVDAVGSSGFRAGNVDGRKFE
jgi:hypothetical protein